MDFGRPRTRRKKRAGGHGTVRHARVEGPGKVQDRADGRGGAGPGRWARRHRAKKTGEEAQGRGDGQRGAGSRRRVRRRRAEGTGEEAQGREGGAAPTLWGGFCTFSVTGSGLGCMGLAYETRGGGAGWGGVRAFLYTAPPPHPPPPGAVAALKSRSHYHPLPPQPPLHRGHAPIAGRRPPPAQGRREAIRS